jgi:hypothetical protein
LISSKPKTITDDKEQTFNAIVKEASAYTEARVNLRDYGKLQGNEDVLVPVSLSITTPLQLLHTLVNKRLVSMNNTWKSDNPGYEDIKIVSGWSRRSDKWASEADYEKEMNRRVKAAKELLEQKRRA